MTAPRVALIHDWLTGMRGGEKVLEVLCELFPSADLYTLVHVPGAVSATIENHRIFTSPLQKFPAVQRYYRHLLPLMPWAIEQFDLGAYRLVISTSHCVAKGAIPGPESKHWCYCHTPMRYIWDQFDDYFGPGKSSPLTRWAMQCLRPRLQRWDVATVSRVHHFLANSKNVKERIHRIYQREADVLYPPVDFDFFSGGPVTPTGELPSFYYLIVSALAPYKRIDLAIDAFNQLKKPLLIIGDGPELSRLRAIAGPTIRFLGWQDTGALRSYYAGSRAVVFPGEEDFGIVPLEAMSAGRPVIALRKGGALETVLESTTGVFFNRPSAQDLIEAVTHFETLQFDADVLRRHAETFSREHCKQEFRRTFIEYADEMS